jgi:hypothetical protein
MLIPFSELRLYVSQVEMSLLLILSRPRSNGRTKQTLILSTPYGVFVSTLSHCEPLELTQNAADCMHPSLWLLL